MILHDTIRDALQHGRPVVALESAVITAGLPRRVHADLRCDDLPGWNAARPINLELAHLLPRIVRDHGAVPALIAMIDGTLRIGLDDEDVDALAQHDHARKVSIDSIAHARATRLTAGTTVAATLLGCAMTTPAIRVFATGGIGGVHRDWAARPDVSADLMMLARTPVCVICAGAKSILDLPATLEVLESIGVPTIGVGTDWFPQFLGRGEGDLRLRTRADDPTAVATLCAEHWSTFRQRSSVLACVPVPAADALETPVIARAIEDADAQALAQGRTGADRTPAVLDRLVEVTSGRSLRTNIALLAQNAKIAAKVAIALADTSEAASPE